MLVKFESQDLETFKEYLPVEIKENFQSRLEKLQEKIRELTNKSLEKTYLNTI